MNWQQRYFQTTPKTISTKGFQTPPREIFSEIHKQNNETVIIIQRNAKTRCLETRVDKKMHNIMEILQIMLTLILYSLQSTVRSNHIWDYWLWIHRFTTVNMLYMSCLYYVVCELIALYFSNIILDLLPPTCCTCHVFTT